MSRREGGGPTPARAVFEEIAEEATVAAETPTAQEAAGEQPAEAPPGEAADPPLPEQRFVADGVEWIARLGGEGMGGTGRFGRAHIVAVHFFRADDPDTPVREALTAAGRFEALYDEELRDLLASARPIVRPDSRS